MDEARVVALLGPRQAGKSTLASALAGGPLAAEYVTLDDEATKASAAGDPTGFIAGVRTPAVIDEIQRVPELLLAIKVQVDRDNSRGQYLITGSANLRRLPTVSDALPGRVDYLTLWPFTQSEIERRRGSMLEALFRSEAPQISGAPVGRQTYADRILAGGFPEAVRRTSAGRARFFEGYVSSIVERDVPETSRVHDPDAVGALLRQVAARSGSLARYQSLGAELGLDGKTVKSYLGVLERMYLIRIRPAWHKNLGKRQIRAPKLYISDSGLMAAMIGIDPERIANDGGLAGSLFETFVTNEIERQASWAEGAITLWHYREAEMEVDVIAERPSGEVVGIEVKSGATVRPSDFSGLKHLRERLGQGFRAGVVLYSGEQTLPFGDRLWAVPLQSLWSGPPRELTEIESAVLPSPDP